ncbi:transposase [Aerococcus urinaeequi]
MRSNGCLEGKNNRIKVIKRVSYGYRNFFNFRSKIFISFVLKPTSKKRNSTSQ